MCCSLYPAEFSNTYVFASKTQSGKHLLGYQNKAKNYSDQKINGMLLPIPAAEKLTSENMVDTTLCPHLFEDIEKALQVRSLSENIDALVGGAAAFSRGFEIFKKGAYRVILAQSAAYLRLALKTVPEEYRIDMPMEITRAYQEWYRGWQMALCLWSGDVEATPILWQFESMYPEKLFLPGVDSHDGEKPDLHRKVARDHNLLVGFDGGKEVTYTDKLSEEMLQIMPQNVSGLLNLHESRNCDWWIDLKQSNINFVEELPPGAN